VQSQGLEWVVLILAFGYAAFAAGLVILCWKLLGSLATVTRSDSRERDRERHDLLATISRMVEEALTDSKERRALQLTHAQERMDNARLNATLEANAQDDLVRTPAEPPGFAPSMYGQ